MQCHRFNWEATFGLQKHSGLCFTISPQELSLLPIPDEVQTWQLQNHLLSYKEPLCSLLYLDFGQFWGPWSTLLLHRDSHLANIQIFQGYRLFYCPSMWQNRTMAVHSLHFLLPVLLTWLVRAAHVWCFSTPFFSLPLATRLWCRRKWFSMMLSKIRCGSHSVTYVKPQSAVLTRVISQSVTALNPSDVNVCVWDLDLHNRPGNELNKFYRVNWYVLMSQIKCNGS